MAFPKTTAPGSKISWYIPTPGKFVVLLLLSVIVLYLSDQYDWFAFNEQKGWTVLVALACVGVGLGLIVVWSVGAYLFGHKLQFGLLLLLLTVPTVAVPCAWLTREMQQAKKVADAVRRIEQGGGSADFYYRLSGKGTQLGPYVESYGHTPPWLRRIFGDGFFGEVGVVRVADKRNFSDVQSLTHIRRLETSSNVLINDSDLDLLASFPFLQALNCDNTQITDEGLKKLQKLSTLKAVVILDSRTTNHGQRIFQDAINKRCDAVVFSSLSFAEELRLQDESLEKMSTEELEAELENVKVELQKLKEGHYQKPKALTRDRRWSF